MHAGIIAVHWNEIWSIEEEVVRLRCVLPAGERELGLDDDRPTGDVVEAGPQLRERQSIEVDGRMAGKVADLDLEFSDERGTPPRVVAIVMGPGALSHRIGGRLGSWIGDFYGRG